MQVSLWGSEQWNNKEDLQDDALEQHQDCNDRQCLEHWLDPMFWTAKKLGHLPESSVVESVGIQDGKSTGF